MESRPGADGTNDRRMQRGCRKAPVDDPFEPGDDLVDVDGDEQPGGDAGESARQAREEPGEQE